MFTQRGHAVLVRGVGRWSTTQLDGRRWSWGFVNAMPAALNFAEPAATEGEVRP